MRKQGHFWFHSPSIYNFCRKIVGRKLIDRHPPDFHQHRPEAFEANTLILALKTSGNHARFERYIDFCNWAERLVLNSWLMLSAFSLSISRNFSRPRHAFVSVALISVSSCSILPEVPPFEIVLDEVRERSVMRSVDQKADPSQPELARGGDQSVDVISEQPDNIRLTRPFRLVGTAITGDTIMRRLAEHTNIEWIAEDSSIFNLEITLDIELATTRDLYDLVNMVGQVAGLNVRWTGNRVAFIADATGSESSTFTDGYIITASITSPELQAVILERYGVSCIQYNTYSICLGEHADLQSAFEVIKSASEVSGTLEWSIVETSADLPLITQTVGLSDLVSASTVRDGLWLVASTDRGYIDLILDIVTASTGTTCEHTVYRPKHRTTNEIVSFLAAVGNFQCAAPVVVSSDAVIHYTLAKNQPKILAMLAGFDAPRPQAKLAVYVVSQNYLAAIGAAVEFDGTIPLSAIDGISAASFQRLLINASRTKSDAVRYVHLTTSGNTGVSIQSTDRVQGSVVVTDGGSQVSGIEERTVGLSVSANGVVTTDAFIGNVSLVDSTLSNDVVFSSVCEGEITIRLNQLVTVCNYHRRGTNDNQALISYGEDNTGENVLVVVSLAEHAVASINQVGALLR